MASHSSLLTERHQQYSSRPTPPLGSRVSGTFTPSVEPSRKSPCIVASGGSSSSSSSTSVSGTRTIAGRGRVGELDTLEGDGGTSVGVEGAGARTGAGAGAGVEVGAGVAGAGVAVGAGVEARSGAGANIGSDWKVDAGAGAKEVAESPVQRRSKRRSRKFSTAAGFWLNLSPCRASTSRCRVCQSSAAVEKGDVADGPPGNTSIYPTSSCHEQNSCVPIFVGGDGWDVGIPFTPDRPSDGRGVNNSSSAREIIFLPRQIISKYIPKHVPASPHVPKTLW